MITVSEALPNEFNIVQDIARRTWPVAYREILSNAQLEYMLSLFYSIEALNKNADNGHRFLIAREAGVVVGFASYELNHLPRQIHIHKIYVLPEAQGRSIGKSLMDQIESIALKFDQTILSLNVNRQNIAQHFYKKIGYSISRSVDIEIGKGYLMEDFIMEKKLS